MELSFRLVETDNKQKKLIKDIACQLVTDISNNNDVYYCYKCV